MRFELNYTYNNMVATVIKEPRDTHYYMHFHPDTCSHLFVLPALKQIKWKGNVHSATWVVRLESGLPSKIKDEVIINMQKLWTLMEIFEDDYLHGRIKAPRKYKIKK